MAQLLGAITGSSALAAFYSILAVLLGASVVSPAASGVGLTSGDWPTLIILAVLLTAFSALLGKFVAVAHGDAPGPEKLCRPTLVEASAIGFAVLVPLALHTFRVYAGDFDIDDSAAGALVKVNYERAEETACGPECKGIYKQLVAGAFILSALSMLWTAWSACHIVAKETDRNSGRIWWTFLASLFFMLLNILLFEPWFTQRAAAPVAELTWATAGLLGSVLAAAAILAFIACWWRQVGVDIAVALRKGVHTAAAFGGVVVGVLIVAGLWMLIQNLAQPKPCPNCVCDSRGVCSPSQAPSGGTQSVGALSKNPPVRATSANPPVGAPNEYPAAQTRGETRSVRRLSKNEPVRPTSAAPSVRPPYRDPSVQVQSKSPRARERQRLCELEPPSVDRPSPDPDKPPDGASDCDEEAYDAETCLCRE